MITKKEFSQAIQDNASVVAGATYLTPKSFYRGNTQLGTRLYEINFGFDLRAGDAIDILYEPNTYAGIHFTVFKGHNNFLCCSSSTDVSTRAKLIYYKLQTSDRVYIDIFDWTYLFVIPKPTPGIKELWNCKISDVTDSVDRSELKSYFADTTQ